MKDFGPLALRLPKITTFIKALLKSIKNYVDYFNGFMNFKNSAIDVLYSTDNFNIPKEKKLVLFVPFFKKVSYLSNRFL